MAKPVAGHHWRVRSQWFAGLNMGLIGIGMVIKNVVCLTTFKDTVKQTLRTGQLFGWVAVKNVPEKVGFY